VKSMRLHLAFQMVRKYLEMDIHYAQNCQENIVIFMRLKHHYVIDNIIVM